MVPAPYTKTFEKERLFITLFTALKLLANGFINEAVKGSRLFGIFQAELAGTATYSANAPGRWMPTICLSSHKLSSPSRQRLHFPQFINGLTTIRAPTSIPFTLLPIS